MSYVFLPKDLSIHSHLHTLCSSTLDSEPSLRWPVSQGGCGLSERRFLPLRFRACLFSRQPTASAWSPPSPKPPRAACSELSSSADTRSWTSSSIVRRKCLGWRKRGRLCYSFHNMPGHLKESNLSYQHGAQDRYECYAIKCPL